MRRILTVLAMLCALMACGPDVNAPSPPFYASPTAVPGAAELNTNPNAPDACTLLAPQDAKAVIGTFGAPSAQPSLLNNQSACLWSGQKDSISVAISVFADKASADAAFAALQKGPPPMSSATGAGDRALSMNITPSASGTKTTTYYQLLAQHGRVIASITVDSKIKSSAAGLLKKVLVAAATFV